MDQLFDDVVHGVGTVLRKLGTVAGDMNEVHWALLMVIVIGTGVLFMRGKTVRGA